MLRPAGLLVLSLLAGSARAEGVPAEAPGELLTIDQAVALALKDNRQVTIASLSVAKWGDQIASTRAQLLPQFEVSITPSYSITPLDLTFPPGAFGTYAGIPIPPKTTVVPTAPGYTTIIGASVVQPLTGLYKGFLTLDQLDVSTQMSKQDLRTQRQTTVNAVRQTYLGVLQAESSIPDLQEQVASCQETLKVVTQQTAEQTVTPPSLLQARAALVQAEYNVGVAQHNLANLKEQLNYQLGRDPATPFHTSPVAEEGPLDTDLDAARAAAIQHRPELQKAKLTIAYNKYNVSLKTSAFIPSVNLMFKYISPITSDVLPKNITYVGIEFKWDIFDWGEKLHDLAQLNKALEQSQINAQDAAAQVLLNVNSSYRALQDARSYLQVAELNRDAARAQLKVAQKGYREQTALLKDLLGAQAALAAASDHYRQAVLNLWVARANFDKAVGTGD
jgi:outer membrane protein TolC